MSDGGKGSKPRPFSVTQEEYDRRWEMIFGRDQDRKEESREDKQKECSDKQNTAE